MSSLLNTIKEYKERVVSLEDEITRLKAGKNGRAAGIDWAIKKMCKHCAAGDEVCVEKASGVFGVFHDGPVKEITCDAETIHIALLEE